MPDNRKVITQEEIDATLAKLETPKTPEVPETPETPEVPEVIETPENPEVPEVPETPETPETPEVPESDPYKKKFAESSREAQILASKNRKITETVEQAAALPEPTEEELKKEYSDWDNLTEFERKMAKDALASSRRFAMIHEAVIQNTKIDEWAKKVDEFVQAPANLQKYPDLDGREAEFRSFAMKETRRGLDFEDLVSSFLYNLENNPTTPVKKGAMVNRPNGGALPTPQPTGFTPEQSALLRKTDQKKWNELVAQGKIKITI